MCWFKMMSADDDCSWFVAMMMLARLSITDDDVSWVIVLTDGVMEQRKFWSASDTGSV